MISVNSNNMIPNNYLPCDGREISENNYPELFKLLKEHQIFKSIENLTWFGRFLRYLGISFKYKRVRNLALNKKFINLPDLRGQFIYGEDELEKQYPLAITE